MAMNGTSIMIMSEISAPPPSKSKAFNEKITLKELCNHGSPSYAVMALRPFCDRIKDALLLYTSSKENDGWRQMNVRKSDDKSGQDDQVNAMKRRRVEICTSDDLTLVSHDSNFQIIETPLEKGRRKERRGYVLLIVNGLDVNKSPADLHPIARQQISWCAKLTHRVLLEQQQQQQTQQEEKDRSKSKNPSTNNNTQEDEEKEKMNLLLLSKVASAVYESLIDTHNFQLETHGLRVDVYPKSLVELFCKSLQSTATIASIQSNNKQMDESESSSTTSPFSGPIQLVKSASRASFVVTVIQSKNNEFQFGIATNDEYFLDLNRKMNDYAKPLVQIGPTTKSGLNLLEKTNADTMKLINKDGGGKVPVSRAYYKLKQVYDECLKSFADILIPKSSTNDVSVSGIDIGAAPGGWTQILHSHFKCPKILSIDPGTLANRVESLEGVKHVRADFTSDAAIEEIASSAPFSVVVSDASIDFHEVMTTIVEGFDKTYALLQNQSGSDSQTRALLATPSAVVITLKLPYKTQGSMDRNLKKVLEVLPERIQSMMQWLGPKAEDKISVQFKVLHLMANSGSERTVIVLFTEK